MEPGAPRARRARIERAVELPIAAEAAWRLMRRTATFVFVAAPLLGVRDPLPERFAAGDRLRLRLAGPAGLPAGRHEIFVESVEEGPRAIQTREHSPLLRRWDHRLSVTETGPASCRYTDEVELDAGPLTVLVAPVARAFFAHRQRRWRALADVLGPGGEGPCPG